VIGNAGGAAREHSGMLFLPAAALLLFVVAYPIARVLVLANVDCSLATGFRIDVQGFEPWRQLAADSRFAAALGNTALFTLISVGLEGIFGLGVALILSRPFIGRGHVRALMMLPWTMPTAVTALAWTWIFNDSFGVLNDLLARLQLVNEPLPWLANPPLAMTALVIADVWKTTPFVALVLLAGLAGIPPSLYEAAEVDAISRRRQLFSLTLPLLSPFLAVALVFRTIHAWAAFDLIYVMTGGGPGGATETVSLYAQQTYFRYLDFGYGSTIAVGAMTILLLVVVGLRRVAPKEAT
jgi:multiple sugar transport system permease protein